MTSSQSPVDLEPLRQRLLAVGDDAPTLEEKMRLVEMARAVQSSPSPLDRLLVSEIGQLRQGLVDAAEVQAQLKGILERLTAPPCFPGICLVGPESTDGRTALVFVAGSERVVSLADGVDPARLEAGSEVLLNEPMNAILEVTGDGRHCGRTANVEKWLPDGRLLLSTRGDHFIVRAAAALSQADLKPGERVRCHEAAGIAFERIEKRSAEDFYLEESPAETFADIGGLGDKIEELTESLRLHLFHAEEARLFGAQPAQSALLVGPPGVGKTMMARALCNWLGELSESGRAHFMNIKPGSLHTKWYSESEANYRAVFQAAREAGEEHPDVPVVMFFDEIDSVAAPRGQSFTRIDDRVMAAFMVELNGLRDRGNVVVLAATNRRDMMDPALLRPGRLCDEVIEVPRPDRSAAAQIFDKHLPETVPTEAGGEDRAAIIDTAVSRIYATGGPAEIATLVFRDGRHQPVLARELMSGAVIGNICRKALRKATWRKVRGSGAGLRPSDLHFAIAIELDGLRRSLSPSNCRSHLTTLPQDADVVRVELPKRVDRPHEFLNVA